MLASLILPFLALTAASPFRRWTYSKYFDLQGHRGGRGEAIEDALPSFATGLMDGVTSLEMDCGLTKDGEVIVWHDESFTEDKCRDTVPAFPGDPQFPYVGQWVANLTLAQIKTLDCGSLRLDGFPLQEVYPGTKIATLQEMFDFVKCATDEPVLFNIESKINPEQRNLTRSPEDFVAAMGKIFVAQGADVVDRITHQSFDWRALIISKKDFPTLRTAALCDDTTIYRNPVEGVAGNLTTHGQGAGNWLAGIDIDTFEGATVGERVARAAHSIKADFLSPVGTSYASPVPDPAQDGWIPFTNKTMVDTAHALGLGVKPWTANRKSLLAYLLDLGIDGIITDYPHEFRLNLERGGYKLAPKNDKKRLMSCLSKYNQLTEDRLDGWGYEH